MPAFDLLVATLAALPLGAAIWLSMRAGRTELWSAAPARASRRNGKGQVQMH